MYAIRSYYEHRDRDAEAVERHEADQGVAERAGGDPGHRAILPAGGLPLAALMGGREPAKRTVRRGALRPQDRPVTDDARLRMAVRGAVQGVGFRPFVSYNFV